MTTATPLPIDGLKLSSELVLIHLPAGEPPPALAVFRKLAAQCINMPFVCLDTGSGLLAGFCIIRSEDYAKAEAALKEEIDQLKTVPSAGALTLFPHRNRAELSANVFAALAADELPLHGIASSLSTLTFFTDFARIHDAVQAVRRVAALPAEHAPFQSALRIRQV